MSPDATPLPRPAGSLRRQLVVLSAVVTAIAAVLLTLLVQLLLERTSTNAVEQVLLERGDSVVSSIRGASSGDTIVVPDSALAPGVAVYDASGDLVAGSVPSSLAEVYDGFRTATEPSVSGEVDDSNRVRADPFALPSGTTGVVVVTEQIGRAHV